MGKYFTPLCVFGCKCKIKSNWIFWTLTIKFAPQPVKLIKYLIYLQIRFSWLAHPERELKEKTQRRSLITHAKPNQARKGYCYWCPRTTRWHMAPPLCVQATPPTHPSSSPTHLRWPICLLSFSSRSRILWGSYSVFLFCLHDLVEVVTIICSWLQLICFCLELLVLGKVFDNFLENVIHAKPNTRNIFSGVFYRTQPNKKKKNVFLLVKYFSLKLFYTKKFIYMEPTQS